MTRRRWTLVAAALLAGLNGCGGSDERQSGDPFVPVEQRPARDRTAARWEHVVTLRGIGDRRTSVDIARGALRWRMRWHCERGRFDVALRSRSTRGPGSARGRCPGERRVELLRTGAVGLQVSARGRWRISIEQEVDTPLSEPPPDRARLVARGGFYPLERTGGGTARLYRLPGGRSALRLESFRTSPNTDLFVWLSRSRRPASTRAALRSGHEVVGPLRSTRGSQNYLLPKHIDAAAARSVVIWCEPVRIAYTAAPLTR